MSISGVRSGRGDGFQTLLAMRSVIEMINDEGISEVEIDSTSLDSSGAPVLIDDVVIKYTNECNTYIQAKKNQPDFHAWTISDLGDELAKAWAQWRREPHCRIKFISRSNFGEIAKLVEHAETQPTATAFTGSLTSKMKKSAAQLIKRDKFEEAKEEDLFNFVKRLNFEVCDPETLRQSLVGQLRHQVAHAERAYAIIHQKLDEISRREGGVGSQQDQMSRHSLTRCGLLSLLRDAGVERCLPRAEAELKAELVNLSHIGRAWQRSVGGQRLTRYVVDEVLEQIESNKSSILISANPGTGKTCVLLDLMERLEKSALSFPIFIQAREFASGISVSERSAIGWSTK